MANPGEIAKGDRVQFTRRYTSIVTGKAWTETESGWVLRVARDSSWADVDYFTGQGRTGRRTRRVPMADVRLLQKAADWLAEQDALRDEGSQS